MAKKRTPKRLVSTDDHPSQDRSNRFAVDALLRLFGYKIFSRYKREVWWERDGRIYQESVVLNRVDQDLLADAEYLEHLYWEGFPE